MDWIRHCYRARMRFWRADPREVWVRWFFVDDDTPMLEGPSYFRSGKWHDPEVHDWLPLGEVHPGSDWRGERPFVNGVHPDAGLGLPLRAAGCNVEGLRFGEDAPPAVPPARVPDTSIYECCLEEVPTPGPPLWVILESLPILEFNPHVCVGAGAVSGVLLTDWFFEAPTGLFRAFVGFNYGFPEVFETVTYTYDPNTDRFSAARDSVNPGPMVVLVGPPAGVVFGRGNVSIEPFAPFGTGFPCPVG